jgi:hypothetical protein
MIHSGVGMGTKNGSVPLRYTKHLYLRLFRTRSGLRAAPACSLVRFMAVYGRRPSTVYLRLLMKNVRELRQAILRQCGIDPRTDGSVFAFCELSAAHKELWLRISRLWMERGVQPERCNDVDLATLLDEEEFGRYLDEATRLSGGSPKAS